MIAPFETDQKWSRPAVKPFDPRKDPLSMLYAVVDADV